jgi:Flp pilus assembly secretin CpaC
VFSDFLNLFLFNTEEQLGTAIHALRGRGLFESLAEPNLITQDGREASFLLEKFPFGRPGWSDQQCHHGAFRVASV